MSARNPSLRRSRRLPMAAFGANAAAFDEQHASVTATTESPQLDGVPRGKIHERLYVAFR
jgi:hypothetical protein